MGNFISMHASKVWRRSKLKRKHQDFNGETDHDHQGIRTVGVNNHCHFSTIFDLCICIITWNMNGQVSYEDLVELVGRNREFDLLVIGLQEVPREEISKMLQEALGKTHMLLGKSIMQSLQIYVFGPYDSNLFTKELKVDKHSVGGLGGLITRKKGAVAIRIKYKRLVMVFISCHLSAHACNVKKRNTQFSRITESLFSKYLNPNPNPNPNPQPAHITVWLGDLNYRVQGINTQPARNLIHDDDHDMHILIEKDQLLREAEEGQIFVGYREGALTFKPTYKYDVGSSNYDTSYKVRVPSWTDRILFKIGDTNKVSATLQSYESIDSIDSSDHKPVKAHICIKLNEETSETQSSSFLNRSNTIQ